MTGADASGPRDAAADASGPRLAGADPEQPVVRVHHKGFPADAVDRPVRELRGLGLTAAPGSVPGGRFNTPVLLLRQQVLAENILALQRFCSDAGLSLAPHVKTTMSPQVVARQLAAGAWAVTVATPAQLRTARRWGVRRVLLANQLLDPDAIDWLGAQLDQDADFTGYCYVDSAAGVAELARVLAARGQRRRLPVLVELGMPDGRSGVRGVAEAVRLAELVARTPRLRLAGVAGFEGIIDARADPDRLGAVETFLRALRTTADRLLAEFPGAQRAAGRVAGEQTFGEPEELLVTVGGSAYPELVRDAFPPSWGAGRPVRVVLRSGCYVTHDSGAYQQFRELLAARRPDPVPLRPALELWARVLSRPEPGLALVDLGRRDAGTDAGLPVPRWWLRQDTEQPPRPDAPPASPATIGDAPPSALVALNDQHGYLRAVAPAADLPLRVGDLVGFGVTHPCTTLDKWRLIPLVDADRWLTGAAETWF